MGNRAMGRGARGIAILAALALAAAAAGSGATSASAAKRPDPSCGPKRTQSRVVNHTFGSTTMSGTPTRVVALEYSFVDALVAVGVKPVGIADDNNASRILPQYRKAIDGYVSVGLRSTPNLEKISSLNPDLIIADADRHRGIFNQLQRIAPTIVLDSLRQAYLPNLHSAVVIGQATNRCGRMIARLARHKANIKKLAAAMPKNESRTALFAVSASTVFNMHNSQGYTPSVLQALGLKATQQQRVGGDPYQELTLETLFTLNPDILIIAKAGNNTMSDKWSESPIWSQLKAVRNSQVYYVNQDLWSRWRGISTAEVIGQQTLRLLYKKYVGIKVG